MMKKRIRNASIGWWLRQLFPLSYTTVTTRIGSGAQVRSTWRMWFGRCFDVHQVTL